jgi:LytS/YehU family sensor histidine kinase
MSRTRAYWLCQITGWSLFWGMDVFIRSENWASGEVHTTLIAWVLRVAVGIGVTHAFRAYAKQQEWTRLPLKRLIPRGLAASVALGALTAAFRAAPIELGLLHMTAHSRADPPFAWGATGDMLLVGCWIAIYFGVHSAWNYRQAEIDRWKLVAEAKAARLEALKLQLNPRFFFNSLASVRALISEAPGRAKKMIARLARLLRRTLKTSDETAVPLRKEIEATKTYLELEKIRLEDRLDWMIDVTETALDQPVPHMLVRTLAENAVEHGISERQSGGTVRIEEDVMEDSDCPEERMLRLRVVSPGTSGEAVSDQRGGTGLENARERLRLLFGEAASLRHRKHESGTVAAIAKFPIRPQGSPADGRADAGAIVGRDAANGHDAATRTPGGDSSNQADAPSNSGAGAPPPETMQTRKPSLNEPELQDLRSARPPQDLLSPQDTQSWKGLLGGSLLYWTCQVTTWCGLVIFTMLVASDTWSQSWGAVARELAIGAGVYGGIGIGLTHAFRAYAKWAGWPNLSPTRLAPRAAGAAVFLGSGFVIVTAPWALQADLPSAWVPWLVAVAGRMVPPAFAFSVIMGVWIVIYFGVQAARNYRQAEVDRWKLRARAETARLEALRLQLNPHFFFNSLASVRALISEAPGRAKKMIARLARLLRKALRAGEKKTVALQREIATTKTYLQLEQVRFEDRLDWRIDASEEALGRQVPFMLLQTLAENAVKHGIGQRRDGGTVAIDADIAGGDGEDPLRLQVTNPGQFGDGAGADRGSGTGLDNARERLRLLFGDEASLQLTQSGPEKVTATAWIPRPSAIEDRMDGREPTPSSPAPHPAATTPAATSSEGAQR